jgi:hypothetical protein
MTHTATGTFDVTLAPLDIEGELMGRRGIDKRFQGALEAVSTGQMLSAGTTTKGSAVYVAIERVRGQLDGRAGSFALYHTGVMNRGEAQLTVLVVPDSGTDALEGLTGSMTIAVEEGHHHYVLSYQLPARD